MVLSKLKNVVRAWLTAKPEDETEYNGFLSSKSEKHAMLGLAIGFITALAGGKDAAWMLIVFGGIALGEREVSVGQLEDVQKEPGYALVSATLAFLITAFIIVPRLPGGII